MDVLSTKGLNKGFLSERGRHLSVLSDLNLTVKRGEFLTLLGSTGSGKTTLMRTLVGLEEPDSGQVRVAGFTPWEGSVPAGVVFQQNSLFPWLTVLDNVAFPLVLQGCRRRQARQEALLLLKMVELENFSTAFPYELSGGMQQRAAIARALGRKGSILFFDEPFGALHDGTRKSLQQIILSLWKERGLTILFITHNIEEALLLGSRLVVMGGGGIIHDEVIDLSRPRDALAPAFSVRFLALRQLMHDGSI